ncbi:MAG: hypothetical protein A2504_03520 [Bdellovibrionales bacterium RIFOXYD12_FULL_39_22]|nr:MAG: hypothetical protein A2385_11270 [Bdellovibrionales bacterium RIFOXYB1_FULL_39_21]OFZ41649.1 MAG: hypothetical protein A2485_01580 [Bdellovibrionales bacterium RIFOXYC12_FULL_39_17]OFZ46049.1 MAG: hypothetical protein A2404_11945 [Bdellovibrionales bacterium RIFOXYC1_FULL_39_130]OFZ71167.1 MAG: hypothetical protein A2451_02750 [Bdellovibrionales bacterium RIFOXYC2_FULL_39_8]OFZ74876.1 MAG: hypothetical protein A2560_14985 [Bdellovibrionales bacterium RIFOXYD1_FULL_39_84]OFZ92729.1 MAG:
MVDLDGMIKFFFDGGFYMYPIAVMLVFGTIVSVERMYMILFVYSTNYSKFMQKIQEYIVDNNIEKALNLCNSNKQSAIHQVFKAALLNADRPFEEIQAHVESAGLSVIPKLQQRIPFLFTIANVATLLGLLGTIAGLIATFQVVGTVEASEKQKLLSVGISTAMNTTAFGLIVAIPCMLVYGFLYNRINTMIDEIDHYTSRLLLLLRTGSAYFDRFSSDNLISTKQQPMKKENKTIDISSGHTTAEDKEHKEHKEDKNVA